MRLYVDGTLITPHGVRRGPECVGQSDGRVSRLSRARISFPVLKVGIAFFATVTAAPVRGLRPVRAPRSLAEKTPKPRSSTRSLRRIDFVEYRADDLLYVALIKVRILRGNAPYEFRFYHGRSLRIVEIFVKRPSGSMFDLQLAMVRLN